MKFLEATGQLLFLVIRGLALWVLIPFAFLAWLLVHSWAQRASLRRAASWYDSNFTLLLAKALLTPQIKKLGNARFIGISQMRDLPAHNLHWLGSLADFSADA